jgi:hypothetical protein
MSFMRRLASFLAVFVLAAIPAAAVTPHEIVEMKKVGVSDTVLLAVIDRDQTIFTLDAKDLADLQREGISERVLLAMLRSGREPRPDAAPATTSAAPVAAPAVPAIADPGTFAVVGHDPDYPGAASSYATGPVFYAADFYGAGYYGMVTPFFFPGVRGRRAHSRANVLQQPLASTSSGPFLADPMRRFQTPIVTIPQIRPPRRR